VIDGASIPGWWTVEFAIVPMYMDNTSSVIYCDVTRLISEIMKIM